MQVPSNAVMNYVGRPSLYLGFFTCAWGLVSLLTSQVKGFGGMVACRFILGIVEAPFFAGVLFYLSKWYTKSELNLRMSIFYSASMLSGAFGPLIAAGILSSKTLVGYHGIRAWQWVCISGHHSDLLTTTQRLTRISALYHRRRSYDPCRNHRDGSPTRLPRHLEIIDPRGKTCGKPPSCP
jgi:MFS family permease